MATEVGHVVAYGSAGGVDDQLALVTGVNEDGSLDLAVFPTTHRNVAHADTVKIGTAGWKETPGPLEGAAEKGAAEVDRLTR